MEENHTVRHEGSNSRVPADTEAYTITKFVSWVLPLLLATSTNASGSDKQSAVLGEGPA